MACERGASFRRRFDGGQVLGQRWVTPRLTALQNVYIPEHDGQHVVETVCDSSGQLPDRVNALCLTHRALGMFPYRYLLQQPVLGALGRFLRIVRLFQQTLDLA